MGKILGWKMFLGSVLQLLRIYCAVLIWIMRVVALGSGCWQLAVGKGRVKAGLKFLVQGSKLGTRTRKAEIPAEWFDGIVLASLWNWEEVACGGVPGSGGS